MIYTNRGYRHYEFFIDMMRLRDEAGVEMMKRNEIVYGNLEPIMACGNLGYLMTCQGEVFGYSCKNLRMRPFTPHPQTAEWSREIQRMY